MSDGRVAVFIDGAYLESVLEDELDGARIDYGMFASEVSRGYELLITYYYNCAPYQSNPPTPHESQVTARVGKFYSALRRLPRFEVRLARLEKRYCDLCGTLNFRQKGADLMLGVDLVNLSAKRRISKAFLVAEDGDLVPAVLIAQEWGVPVHLLHGGSGRGLIPPHYALSSVCDDRTLISRDLIERVERRSSCRAAPTSGKR